MTDNIKISCVSVIGSFKQHYDIICEACTCFINSGLNVTTPLGVPIIEEGIKFVRFYSDPPDWNDYKIQTIALHRNLYV